MLPNSMHRFKLTTTNFFTQLESVRSFMNFRAVEDDAEALRLLRQLLWVDSLDAIHAGGKDAPHVINLCAQGQAVIGNDLRCVVSATAATTALSATTTTAAAIAWCAG